VLALLLQTQMPALAQFQPEPGGPLEEGATQQSPAAPTQPVAPAPEAAPLPQPEEAVPAAKPAPRPPIETRISVRVSDAPLASFLNAISAQAKVSFIIGEGVEKVKITAFLQNVTVREALDVLLETKGLTYSRIGKTNTFVISQRATKGPPTTSRIYQLNYIPLVEVAAPAGAPAPGGQPPGPPGAPGAGGAAGAPPGILSVIQSALSPVGKLAVDTRTNSIIVTDVADVFPHVEQLIAELDKKAPQVMFEAQIVEIDTDRSQQLGIEWGGPNGELVSFTGPSRTTDWPLRPGLFKGNKLGFFFPKAAALESGAAPSDAYTAADITAGVFSLQQLTAVLKALVSRSEARFLGKPKVLTLNNRAATIEITRDQAIGTITQIAGQTGITSSTTSAERKPTGLVLKVTPQVNKEGYITVLVEPEFSDVVGSSISPGIFDTIKRKASTLVRVKNGQTLVLGGLLQSKEVKVTRKVPFLGYIPILGWLFTSQTVSRANTDLVIFITPTVLND